jgi:hypothetical protein
VIFRFFFWKATLTCALVQDAAAPPTSRIPAAAASTRIQAATRFIWGKRRPQLLPHLHLLRGGLHQGKKRFDI